MQIMQRTLFATSVLASVASTLPNGGSELDWTLPLAAPGCDVDRPSNGAGLTEETSDVHSAFNVSVDRLAHGKSVVYTLRIRPHDDHLLTGLLCKNTNAAVKGRFVGISHGFEGIEARAGEKGAECVTHTEGVKISKETVLFEYSTKQTDATPVFYCVLVEDGNKWWTVTM